MVVGVLTGDGLHHDGFGQLDFAVRNELVRRYKFTPGIARHVGNEAFHLRDFVLFQPRLNGGHIGRGHLRRVTDALRTVCTCLIRRRFMVRLTHNAPRATQQAHSIGWRLDTGKRHNANHE